MSDILTAIDAAIGCQQCTGPLGGSPSGDFCSEPCQSAWHSSRSQPLIGYREPLMSWATLGPALGETARPLRSTERSALDEAFTRLIRSIWALAGPHGDFDVPATLRRAAAEIGRRSSGRRRPPSSHQIRTAQPGRPAAHVVIFDECTGWSEEQVLAAFNVAPRVSPLFIAADPIEQARDTIAVHRDVADEHSGETPQQRALRMRQQRNTGPTTNPARKPRPPRTLGRRR